jgi:uncharacterized protein (TIGR02598 family)
MNAPHVASRAFTLVEVVVALGIFTFCLVCLFGLFSVGMANSRKSSENTSIASMSSQVLSSLQTQNTNAAGQSLTYYFDVDGQMTNATASYFTCQVNFINASGKGLSDTADSSLLSAQFNFSWPPHVTPSPNTNIVNVTLPPGGS